MDNYIDIGIDFGAENIVVIAIGKDNLNRSDLRLINLDNNTAIKNYIAENKNNNNIEIGSEIKSYYIHKKYDDNYNWVLGRYKAYILENDKPFFSISPDNLFNYGIAQIIEKIKKFDFSILLSGRLRNLCVGIPQSWSNEKKIFYYKSLTKLWNLGSVYILPEPIAATITVYKKSLNTVSNKKIMILDIGASTFDISFSEYNEDSKKLDIQNINYRSNYAGHFFDSILTAFTLYDSINRNANNELIDRITKLKLRKVEDYINYININQEKFSILLLEIENIKENYISDIIKFNRKKIIDINLKNTIIINRQIYDNALKYYVSLIYSDIQEILEKINYKDIIPILCGGLSALYGLEKELSNNFNDMKLFSLSKENYGNKIDSTIAIGLAYYAQNKNIIEKKLDYPISINILNDDNIEENINLFEKEEIYPNSKTLLGIFNNEIELEYKNISDNTINFKLLKDTEEYIIKFNAEKFDIGDLFDIYFKIEINEILICILKNLKNNYKEYYFLPI